VLLLAVAVRLVLDGAARTTSYVLVVGSLACLLIADPLYTAFTIHGDYGSGSPLDAGWILAYLLFGAAALHPSMRVTAEPAPETVPKLTPTRLVLLAAAALAAPAVLAYRPERVGVACTAALILLVGTRLAGMIARHERALARESRLRAAAATLVAATTDAEIHRAAVETAVAFAGHGARATLTLEDGPVATAGDLAVAGACETFPLVVTGERRGALEVETTGGVADEDRAALETLAAQVGLALETVARAREKADAERRHVRDLFTRFVPEAVVEQVLAQAGGVRLGGETLHGTIMFTDLRGFTTFSESRAADEVIEILNYYFGEISQAVFDHGGTLVSYLGDGMMSVFGAPLEQPDHADRAVAAAREIILERLPRVNQWIRDQGYGDGFRMGIGVNSGEIMTGNIGSERRMEYTTIGDPVNTASRLEGMTKGTPFPVFISDTTRELLQAEPEDIVYVAELEVRGRTEKVKVWSLRGLLAPAPAARTEAVPDSVPAAVPTA
jgi:adenylate cyclase